MIDTVRSRFQKYWLLIYAMMTAAIILFICSKSSPLYPMNDWVDVHCFLTMGKGLLNGMIPYVDLYEQKGPVLYFIYAIVALFCQKDMLGQYLLEIVTVGLFLYFSAKLACIYIGEKSRYKYPIVVALASILCTSFAFRHGGSVEQMCLFFFAYGLYSVLKACHEDRPLSFPTALTNGIFAGMALWIKYTMLGFYMGLALFVLIWYIIRFRSFAKIMTVVGHFLLGVGIVTGLVLLFFLCVGGLDELFTCYFYNNIFLYDDHREMSIFAWVWDGSYRFCRHNRSIFCFIALGMIWSLLQIKKNTLHLLAVVLTIGGQIIGTFTGANFYYYGLVLSTYIVFGLICIALLARKLKVSRLICHITKNHRIIAGVSISIFFVLCALVANKHNCNVYMRSYSREDMPQYKFAEIIDQTEDPTLLNFGFLDSGFYHAADVLPTNRYFCTFNVTPPGMWGTQIRAIRSGGYDYVVVRGHDHNAIMERIHGGKYELISTAEMYYEYRTYPYYLYKLKGTG